MCHFIVSVCVVLVFVVTVVRGDLVTSPYSVAAVTGQTVLLECLAADDNDTEVVTYDWLYNAMSHTPILVVYDCQVHPDYESLYIAEMSAQGGCNLNVLDVSLKSAGTYTCQHGFDTGSADVVIITSNSSCSYSPTEDFVSGDPLDMFCVINYNGTSTPQFQWRDDQDNILYNATTNVYPNQVNSRLIVPVYPPKARSYTSTTFFNPPITFTYTWYSPQLDVQHAVSDVMITVSGAVCDDMYYVNMTSLLCTATGYPAPQYVWVDIDTDDTANGDTVMLSQPGLNNWRCTASNEFRNTTYSDFADIQLNIIDGVPPTSCPVEETTSGTTSSSTTAVSTTSVPVTSCGSILHVAPNSTVIKPGYHRLCYLTRDDTEYLNTQCRNLIQNLPPDIGDGDGVIASGGNYGCFLTSKTDLSDADQACFDNFQHDRALSICGSCQRLIVCIRLS